MLAGVNDTRAAAELATRLEPKAFKVNLIPYNPTGTYDGSSREAIDAFRDVLVERGPRDRAPHARAGHRRRLRPAGRQAARRPRLDGPASLVAGHRRRRRQGRRVSAHYVISIRAKATAPQNARQQARTRSRLQFVPDSAASPGWEGGIPPASQPRERLPSAETASDESGETTLRHSATSGMHRGTQRRRSPRWRAPSE